MLSKEDLVEMGPILDVIATAQNPTEYISPIINAEEIPDTDSNFNNEDYVENTKAAEASYVLSNEMKPV